MLLPRVRLYKFGGIEYTRTMGIAFLLHLYQPPTQSEVVFRQIAEESYLPLLRTIKNSKKFKVTLNLPLSLLELADRWGYKSWINDIKELVDSDRVELVGSAAYHPLLTKIPEPFMEKQITLNEFGLGYYFGKHAGFEGEKAVLIRDVAGFFPPELAINEALLHVLAELNYDWVLVDETAITQKGAVPFSSCGVYQFGDISTQIVCRNKPFSNMLSFKRDLDIEDILKFTKELMSLNLSFVAALDGEFFGHHFKEGVHLLDSMISTLGDLGVEFMTVSEYVSGESPTGLEVLKEATWGASDEDVKTGNIYPAWDVSGNDIHRLQWEMIRGLFNNYTPPSNESSLEDYEVLPIWVPKEVEKIKEDVIKKEVKLDLLVSKALHSDQFWWSSKRVLGTGEVLFRPDMVVKSLELLGKTAEALGSAEYQKLVEKNSAEIKNLL